MARDDLVRFGPFEADLRAGELRCSDIRIHLQEQPFRILQMLLEHPGEIVTREEIRNALWPENQFGDFDHAINVAIKKLRDALADDPDTPRFVETMARRGYRFIAQVQNGKATLLLSPDGNSANTNDSRADYRGRLLSLKVLLACTCLLLAGLTIYTLFPNWVTTSSNYRPVLFTTLQGNVLRAAFSPDGEQIAYSWQRHDPTDARIYLQTLGSVVAKQLIDDGDPNHSERVPVWFPDGRRLAYVRKQSNGIEEIWVVPRSGGPALKLLTVGDQWGFDISPDGTALVVAQRRTGSVFSTLYCVTLKDLSYRQLTFPPDAKPWTANAKQPSGDRNPQFSPDGKSIAFLRLYGTQARFMRIATAGGHPETLTEDLATGVVLPSFAWARDGDSLVIVAERSGSPPGSWWRFWLRRRWLGKEWEPLPLTGGYHPTLASRGKRLAYLQAFGSSNIYQFKLTQTKGEAGAPVNLTRSAATNVGPKHSPNGRQIVFASNRSGHFEIYVADSDGAHTVQLTSFNGKDCGSPRWSPDGRRIAFDARPDEHVRLFLIDSTGGVPRQMTFGDFDDAVPRYSKDGKWIYFVRLRKGGADLLKMPSEGGEAILVAEDGLMAEESPDGKSVYYSFSSKPGIAVRAVEGGQEHLVIRDSFDSVRGSNSAFVVMKDGIYYRRRPIGAPEPQLMFYRFATRKSNIVLPLHFPTGDNTNISVSPDRKYFLVSVPEFRSNVVLVESFP